MNRPDYYSYMATFSKDDDGWLVEFPDLERCATNADTLDEIRRLRSELTGLYLTVRKYRGERKIPVENSVTSDEMLS